MTTKINEKLEVLANLLIDCREIPSAYIDQYGPENYPNVPLGLGDFLIFEKQQSAKDNGFINETQYKIRKPTGRTTINPDNHTFDAIVFTPDRERAYYFSRTDKGCLTEKITYVDMQLINELKENAMNTYQSSTNLRLGSPILKIGLNPQFKENEETADDLWLQANNNDLIQINLQEDSNEPINIPTEDINELINRFSGLLQAYKKSKNT